VALGYPTPVEEAQMLRTLEGAHPIGTIAQVVDGAQLPALQQAIWGIHVEDKLRDYIIRLATATRSHADLALGASPRATFALFRAAQAHAALHGREYVIPDDIKSLTPAVWRHRLLLRPESALRGRSAGAILDGLLGETLLEIEN
jgi:MoxR-like ATPase